MTDIEISQVTRATVGSLRPVVEDALPSMPQWTYDEVVRLAGDPGGYVIALRIDGRPIGYVMAQLVWDPQPGVLLAMVHHNYVLPRYRGQTRPWWPVVHAMVEAWAQTHRAAFLACLATPRWSVVLQRRGWQYRADVDGQHYLTWRVGVAHVH